MGESQPDVGPTAPYGAPVQTPSGQNTQRSQQSALQKMAPNSQPGDYHNSASTTTSGQKTSDRSNRSSDRSAFGANTQSTNGVAGGMYPDFSAVQNTSGGSQLPDTQGSSSFDSWSSTELNESTEPSYQSSQGQMSSNSQPSQQSSQQFSVPALPRQPPGMPNVLNAQPQEPPQPTEITLSEKQLDELHHQLVERSSGLSVEQLEQVNAALMDAVWRTKGNWDRNQVIVAVAETFNETIKDIEMMQRIFPPSQNKPPASP